MSYFQENSGFSRPRMRIGPGVITPFIKILLITNLVVFIAQQIWPQLSGSLGLVPGRFFADFPNWLFQPFTYMFLHASFGHILFNMFALWMFGTEIEQTWGTKRFARFYLFGGLAGALLTLLVYPNQPYPTIGASAAIYSLLIAYWIMFPNRKLYIYFVLPVKVKYAIPGVMLLGFLFGGASIAHMAHLGGAIYGVIALKLDWRWLSFGKKIKEVKRKRNESKLQKNRLQAEQIMKRVDEILDKINEVGFDGLSREEKKFLEDASSELSKKNQD